MGGAGTFWSSSTTATNANRAWNIGMGIGRILSAAKGQSNQVWPVRGETPNRPPTADAGQADELECTSQDGASVTLDGSGSTDPDSAFGTNDDIRFFDWYLDYQQPSEIDLGSGEIIDVTLPVRLARHHAEGHRLRGRDRHRRGGKNSRGHGTLPDISIYVTPNTLWPPNHRLVDIEASVVANDVCSIPTVALTSVASNESDNGEGDGNTINDIQEADIGTADFHFELRAERAGGGAGRVYTATYTATDGSANPASASAFVVVPHDQGGITDPIELVMGQGQGGTLVSWTETPGAQSYDVIRGELENIGETDVVINPGHGDLYRERLGRRKHPRWGRPRHPRSRTDFLLPGWSTSTGPGVLTAPKASTGPERPVPETASNRTGAQGAMP